MCAYRRRTRSWWAGREGAHRRRREQRGVRESRARLGWEAGTRAGERERHCGGRGTTDKALSGEAGDLTSQEPGQQGQAKSGRLLWRGGLGDSIRKMNKQSRRTSI